METGRKRRWSGRSLVLLIPFLGVSLWYGSRAVGYVANLRVFSIPSASMSPALAPGDRIAVDIRGGTPHRREIWVFSMPQGGTAVKRVIGLPGETVRVSGGRVLVDDRPLDEPYLAAPITYSMPPVRLGADEYFMMGDSRNASHDSHVWGPLAKGLLIGRAEHRYWPKGRIGGLNRGPDRD